MEQIPEDYVSKKGFLQFEVEDTGIGIAEDDIANIFLPFEQVGSVHKKHEGTGLGLSICQKILLMMNSRLQVKSCLGVGSNFSFGLPISATEKAFDISMIQSSSLNTIIGYKGERKKILIVDDRSENISLLTYLLEPLGFILEQASDGIQGLKKFSRFQPDLIIADLIMPNMDGWEMIKSLRQLTQGEDVIIIVSSANVSDINQSLDQSQSDRQYCQEIGCDYFLPKPLEIKELLNQLGHHLQLEWIYQSSSPPKNKEKKP